MEVFVVAQIEDFRVVPLACFLKETLAAEAKETLAEDESNEDKEFVIYKETLNVVG